MLPGRSTLLLSIALLSSGAAIPLAACSDDPRAAAAPADAGSSDGGAVDPGADASTDAGPPPVHLVPFSPDAGGSLADAIESTAFLYIPPGDYVIDRPVKVSGRRRGVVLGAGRGATRIRLDGRAGITIEDGQDLVIGNFDLTVVDPSVTDDVFHITGAAKSQVSFLAILIGAGRASGGHVVGRTSFRIDSPSDVLLQGVHISTSDNGVLVDHPGADVHLLGGNHQSNNTHVRQKRGHLDMRAVGIQIGYDQDILIEGASGGPPHVIEAVRSEGPLPFLVVPPTAEKVDVLMAANSVNVAKDSVRYAGGGTLWMVNNNLIGGVTATAGAVRSFGNAFDEGSLPADHVATPPFAISATATAVSTGDLLAVKNASGAPYYRSLVVNAAAFTAASLPQPAQTAIATEVAPGDVPAAASRVVPVDWPLVDNLAELMPSVKTFGAIGDGVADDTDAIAAAVASSRQKALYFPPGTYLLTKPILVEHWFGTTFWGEGPDTTRLLNTADGTVFQTNGCGYSAFIGLTFETRARGTGKPLDMSWDGTNTPESLGGALQANMFYRTAFVGGSEAVSLGAGGSMGSEHLFIHARFTKAGIGLAVHNYNALTNVAVDSEFTDLDLAAAQSASGNFHLFGDRFSNITRQGISCSNTAWDTFVIRDAIWNEATPILGTGFTGARIQVLLANIVFPPRLDPANSNAFFYGAGGSLTLFGVDLGDRTLRSYSSADGEGTVVVLAGKATAPAPYTISNQAHLIK